jgi:hypothetical protein
MAMVRRHVEGQAAPSKCYHSGVAGLQVLLLVEHPPGSLGGPDISFSPGMTIAIDSSLPQLLGSVL